MSNERIVVFADGPLMGRDVRLTTPAVVLIVPELDGDGRHFISHEYGADGRWLNSSTYVGYESEERQAEREAFWEAEYWNSLEPESGQSFA